jgi:hypothetical protein
MHWIYLPIHVFLHCSLEKLAAADTVAGSRWIFLKEYFQLFKKNFILAIVNSYTVLSEVILEEQVP